MSRNRYLPSRSVLEAMLEAAGISPKEKLTGTAGPKQSNPSVSLLSQSKEAPRSIQSKGSLDAKPLPDLNESAEWKGTQSLEQPHDSYVPEARESLEQRTANPKGQLKPPHPEGVQPIASQQKAAAEKIEKKVQPTKKGNSFRFNPKSPMEQNLRSFLMWLMNRINAEGGFLTDSHGLALVACNVSMDFIESTGALSQGLNLMSEFGPNTDMGSCLFNLGPERHLLITWTETAEGRMFFGLVTTTILNPKKIRFIRTALKKIVDREGDVNV